MLSFPLILLRFKKKKTLIKHTMKKIIILLIILIGNYNITYCQKDSVPVRTFHIQTFRIQTDSTSLLYPLLDTIFVLDANCVRTCYCDSNNVVIANWDTLGKDPRFIIYNGDCISYHLESLKGISYYKQKTIYWVKAIPSCLGAYITEEQVDFVYKEEELLPLIDGIPLTLCCSYGRLFIYNRFCYPNSDNNVYPIIIE